MDSEYEEWENIDSIYDCSNWMPAVKSMTFGQLSTMSQKHKNVTLWLKINKISILLIDNNLLKFTLYSKENIKIKGDKIC